VLKRGSGRCCRQQFAFGGRPAQEALLRRHHA
jgi:hypothetical protein